MNNSNLYIMIILLIVIGPMTVCADSKSENSKTNAHKQKHKHHQKKPQEKFFSFGLGAGFALGNNIRKDNRAKDLDGNVLFQALPIATIKIWRCSLGGMGFGCKIFGGREWEVSGVLSYAGDKYNGDKMYFRKQSLVSGFSGKYKFFNFSFLHDIQNESNGGILDFGVSTTKMLTNKIIYVPSTGIKFLTNNYTNYYYGIRGDEVMIDRPYYVPKNGRELYVSQALMIMLSDSFMLRTAAGVSFLSSAIYDSPTVTKKRRYFGMLAIIWK